MKRVLRIARHLHSIQFVRDVLTLQIGSVFAHTFGLISSVAYARLLGIETFGIYSIVLAFKGTFGILTGFGQNQASTTFFAESYSKKDKKGMEEVLHYYITLSLFAVIILFVLAFIAPWLSEIMYNDKSIGELARIAFLVMIAGSFHSIFFIILQTIRKIKLLTFLENFNLLLQLGLSLTFLLTGQGVKGIFIGLLLSNIIMQIILLSVYFYIRKEYSIPSLGKSILTRYKIRHLLGQGIWIAIDKNIANFFLPSMLLIMSMFAEAKIVGIARLAYNIGLLPASLLLSHAVRMGATVIPAIQAQGANVLRKNIAKLIKHTMAFHALISFGSLIGLPIIVIIVYGLEYSAVINPMLWIILIALLRGVAVSNSTLLRVYRKTHVAAIWGGTSFLVSVLLFLGMLQHITPINAFILTVLIYHVLSLYINWYIYKRVIPNPTD